MEIIFQESQFPISVFVVIIMAVKSRVLIGWDASRAGPYVSVLDRSGLQVSSAILFTKEQRKETFKRRKNLTNLIN